MFRLRQLKRPGGQKVRKFITLVKSNSVPLIGATIGLIALTFQISVLYPWHVELSNQFNSLESVTSNMKNQLKELENQIVKLEKLEEQVRAREDIILEKEDKIILTEAKLLAKIEEISETLKSSTKP